MPTPNPKPAAATPPPEYEVERNLVLCTSHVTKQDSLLLTAAAEGKRRRGLCDSLIVYDYPEGFFVYCGGPGTPADEFEERASAARDRGFSPAVTDCMRLAYLMGCKFLHLDADGPEVAGLQTHEW